MQKGKLLIYDRSDKNGSWYVYEFGYKRWLLAYGDSTAEEQPYNSGEILYGSGMSLRLLAW